MTSLPTSSICLGPMFASNITLNFDEPLFWLANGWDPDFVFWLSLPQCKRIMIKLSKNGLGGSDGY